ncbi:MAG: sporulation integral membrane protein YtvI [Desulfitobacteriaceae bacterium]
MKTRKMVFLCVLGAVILLLIPYSVPLILALLTSILLEPLVLLVIRILKVNRIIAVTISFILFLAVFGLGGYWVGTILVVQSLELAQRLPAFSIQFFDLVEKYIWRWEAYYASFPAETGLTIHQVLSGLKSSAVNTASSLAKWILGAVASIPEFLLISIVYLVGLFLISFDLPGIRARFMGLFTISAREKVELVLTQLSRATVGFFCAQFILSLITYSLALMGLLILDVKYAALIAFLIILVDVFPIIGTGSFFIPWAVYNLLIGNPRLAIGLIILFVVITVIRRIVEPKILGSSLGISALAALISLYLGFQLLGFFGLILGPGVVIIYQALRKAGFIKFKIDF